jgi:hypothetical protein
VAIAIDHIIDSMEGIVFMTAADGTIVSIGRRNWNRFALENDGAALLDGRGVLGRSLFDFISGESVRDTYQGFFAAMRSGSAQRARLMSRCDSPTVRRELWIVITPVHQERDLDGFLVQSLTVSETVRPPIDLFDFQAMLERSRRDKSLPILTMCSYCQDVRYPSGSSERDGTWLPAEDYYHLGGDANVRISHGICPACEDESAKAIAC